MKRQKIFLEFGEDPWFGRLFKRLTREELEFSIRFIRENDSLDTLAFEYTVNRLFLGKAIKPKHWTELTELLICTNSKFAKSGK